MIDAEAILEELYSRRMSIREFGDRLEAMNREDRQIMSKAIKDNLHKKIKDGSFSREIYEAARPEIEKHDRAMRYDGPSGRYRI